MNTKRVNSLTPRQLEVLTFLKNYIQRYEYAPSLEEVAKHLDVTVPTVHQHISELQRKGYLFKGANQSRSIQMAQSGGSMSVQVPLIGSIAAGKPITTFEEPEPTTVPTELIRRSENHYALRVVGQSMVDAGILDGDLVLIRQQSTAEPGDIVVGVKENEEATLKEYGGKDGDGNYVLIPKSSDFPNTIIISPEDFQIRGKYIGLIRQVS